MARADQALSALKYQVATFGAYIKTNYSANADLTSDYIFHIEPFDATQASSFSPILPTPNYAYIITNFGTEPTPDYPTGYLREKFTADIIVVRKSLRTKDRTNNRNLIQFGGTDDAGNTVTSIERICTDLQKWFRVLTQGGKLANSSGTEMAFKCDIQGIGELSQTGDFYYKVCKFEALSMESVTISAT